MGPCLQAAGYEAVYGGKLRSARYKYCVLHHDEASEELLCDLHEDPLETVNLAGSPAHRRLLRDHRSRLAAWTRQAGDGKGAGYLAAL